MNRKNRTLILILMTVMGVGLFSYPAASNFLFERNASTLARNYEETVEQTDKSALERALQEAILYNESLEGDPVHDPFLEGSGMAIADNYTKALDLDGSQMMGYITIPKIGVKISIYHGTAEETLQKGIGHLEASSLPIGGEGAHCVLTGHTGLGHAKMFTDLSKLMKEDVFYLHILENTLAYQVDQIKKVLPEEISDLARVPNEDYCTLITCTPYGINTHRLLVRGKRIAYVPEAEQEPIASSAVQWLTEWNTLIGLAVGLAFAVIVILLLILRRKKSGRKKKGGYWWEETNP